MNTLHLVTKNLGKLMAAKNAFDKYDIKIVPLNKDYPEIQAETSLEIACFTALQAAKDINLPAVREDHSLFIHGLNIPGPYTSYIEKKLPAKKFINLLEHLNDRTGHFEIATVYAEPNGKTFEHVFRVPITFSKTIKGKDSKSWNGLIKIKGEKRTLAEYPEKERLSLWNQGYEAIAKHITSK